MKNKIIAMFLCMVFLFNALCETNELEASGMENALELEYEAENIDFDDIPDDVIPISFDNCLDAKKYLDLDSEMRKNGKTLDLSLVELIELYDENKGAINLSDIDLSEKYYTDVDEVEYGNIDDIELSENTDVKSKKFIIGITQRLTVRAKYSFENKKFKKVKKVTSSYTGITIGNKWFQETYSSKITKNGKRLDVHVYGHYDHFILLDWGALKIGSTDEDYKAGWDY